MGKCRATSFLEHVHRHKRFMLRSIDRVVWEVPSQQPYRQKERLPIDRPCFLVHIVIIHRQSVMLAGSKPSEALRCAKEGWDSRRRAMDGTVSMRLYQTCMAVCGAYRLRVRTRHSARPEDPKGRSSETTHSANQNPRPQKSGLTLRGRQGSSCLFIPRLSRLERGPIVYSLANAGLSPQDSLANEVSAIHQARYDRWAGARNPRRPSQSPLEPRG